MKSIKEKSEEHLNSVYSGYDDVLKKLVKEGYEAGANYVLDAIAIILNQPMNDYLVLEEVWNTLKELKSNQ